MERVEQLPNECCRDQENRGPVVHLAEDLSVTRCQVCGCQHYFAVAEPGAMVSTGSDI